MTRRSHTTNDTDADRADQTTEADDVAGVTEGTGRDNGANPLVKRADEVSYEAVSAAEGLRKGVLVGEDDGAPTFALRRFTLDPGARVPPHTNEIEHQQHVLKGEYVVGIDGHEHAVEAGDSLLIPAGVPHWYRNDADNQGAFICGVPNGDDEIELVDD